MALSTVYRLVQQHEEALLAEWIKTQQTAKRHAGAGVDRGEDPGTIRPRRALNAFLSFQFPIVAFGGEEVTGVIGEAVEIGF